MEKINRVDYKSIGKQKTMLRKPYSHEQNAKAKVEESI